MKEIKHALRKLLQSFRCIKQDASWSCAWCCKLYEAQEIPGSDLCKECEAIVATLEDQSSDGYDDRNDYRHKDMDESALHYEYCYKPFLKHE